MSDKSSPEINPYVSPQSPVAKPVVAKPAKAPIPAWAWVFAVACGLIPFLTLGGAIPGAIGFGGAGGCIGLARNAETPVALRIAGCVGITLACYAGVIAFRAAMFAARG